MNAQTKGQEPGPLFYLIFWPLKVGTMLMVSRWGDADVLPEEAGLIRRLVANVVIGLMCVVMLALAALQIVWALVLWYFAEQAWDGFWRILTP